MIIDEQKVKQRFAEFIKDYNPDDPKVALKIAHTYRVAELCKQIAASIDMSEADQQLAWLLGMLHDVGRFEQVRIYHTFIDRDSVDHAELGADFLFKGDRLIEEFIDSREYDYLIEIAIRSHNKFRIEYLLDGRTECFCHLLRDADKLDIMRVNYEEPIEGIFETTEELLKKESISPEAMEQIYAHHAITRDACHTNMDHYLGHVAMAFELVFPKSRRLCVEMGYLMKLFDFKSDNPETAKALENTKKEILSVLES